MENKKEIFLVVLSLVFPLFIVASAALTENKKLSISKQKSSSGLEYKKIKDRK